MANGSSRVLAVIVSLIVGVAAGLLAGRLLWRAQGGPLHAQVGPNACDLLPKSHNLSKNDWDTLIWTTKGTSKRLYIEFAAPPAAQDIPFYGMVKQPNGRYRVLCHGGSCFSGAINPEAREGEYKYWQVLDDGSGHPDECDGMIIIKP